MSKDKSMNKKIIVGTLAGCIFGATVGYSASVVSLPHTFTSGTPIKASEVNANFSALAQEISKTNSSLILNKSSNFTEVATSSVNVAVGSVITVGSKNFVIKQKTGIEDPITGKRYNLNYPQESDSESGLAIFVTTCRQHFGTNIIVRLGLGAGFNNYVAYYRRSDIGYESTHTNFYIQIDNLCASLMLENSVDLTRTTALAMMDRAIDLQKYISVQEL